MQKDAEVILKPWLGISPRVYVPVIAGGALLLGLFFLLWYPGIRHFGSLVQFTTSPSGSAVFNEEGFLGTTPFTAFLPQGNYQLHFEKRGFTAQTQKLSISGRRFASLIFPKKAQIRANMTLEDEEDLLAHTLEYVALSSALPSNQIFTYNPVLQNAVQTLLEIARPDLGISLLLHALPHMAGEALQEDFTAAEALLIDSLPEKNQLYNELLQKFPFFPLVQGDFPLSFSSRFFPEESHALIADWDDTLLVTRRRASGRRLRLHNIPFRFVKGGSYVPSEDAQTKRPVVVEIPDLYFMETEVTVGMFTEFLIAHPEWQKEAVQSLMDRELATEDYLLESDAAYMPLRFVSWHASQAFADYLTRQLQQLPGWETAEARLPHPWEWEYAARMNNDWNTANILQADGRQTGPQSAANAPSGAIGLRQMYGNLWEWTEGWFSEHPEVTHNGSAHIGVSKEIRGGSWVSSTRTLHPYSRGAHFPSWSTPYLGFRLVIIHERTRP